MNEAYVEHDGAKVLVCKIEKGDPDGEYYGAQVNVLSEMIKHHVKEERKQRNMFDKARKASIDSNALAAQMADEKKKFTAEYKRSGWPKPPPPTFQSTKVA